MAIVNHNSHSVPQPTAQLPVMPTPEPVPPDHAPFLSLIVPAYNEERRLLTSLRQIKAYLQRQSYPSEVIVVDDGSVDGTAEVVETFMSEYTSLHLVRAVHGGKGHACKQGIFHSRGQWLFLCDADLSMPIAELSSFVPLFNQRAPILIASRELPASQRYGEPWYRHLMGRVFNALVQMLAVRGIQDTQCGFKCFRADVARDIFRVQRISGWGFDVEVLFVARKRGYDIIEVPINWYYRSHSKVHPLRDTIHMFREVWQVRWNDWHRCYEASENLADLSAQPDQCPPDQPYHPQQHVVEETLRAECADATFPPKE